MESLARIPFLRDWPDSHRDLRFATCFRNRSSTFVLARQRYFKRPRPGGMEMRAILDLGAGGTALFTFAAYYNAALFKDMEPTAGFFSLVSFGRLSISPPISLLPELSIKRPF